MTVSFIYHLESKVMQIENDEQTARERERGKDRTKKITFVVKI